MSFHIMKQILLLTALILFQNINTPAIAKEIFERKDARSLVCTSGATECQLKEMLTATELPIISLNLEKATNLANPLSLFKDPLPNLQHLKLRFSVDSIVGSLPEKTPNLTILDISQAHLCDVTLLTGLSHIPCLRVLDISQIPFQPKILPLISQLLATNSHLSIYITSFKKLSPTQELPDLSIYKANPRIVLGSTWASSVKAVVESEKSNVVIY